MEIVKVEQKAITLDKEELGKMKQCFNYLYHRATQHPESYVSRDPYFDFINYTRKKLQEV